MVRMTVTSKRRRDTPLKICGWGYRCLRGQHLSEDKKEKQVMSHYLAQRGNVMGNS